MLVQHEALGEGVNRDDKRHDEMLGAIVGATLVLGMFILSAAFIVSKALYETGISQR